MQDKVQLFCFTYAGGTSSFFDEIEKDLDGIELVKFEYAGHGKRHKEDFYKDFGELAQDLYMLFKERYKGGNYALFGYSMGSIGLVEVLKLILKEGIKPPVSIFLAAHEPNTKYGVGDYSSEESDECTKKRTLAFGAVPKVLTNNKTFWRTYLPIYRADYALISKYDFALLDMKSDIPTAVFYSESDTPIKDMRGWDNYFPCEYFNFSGTHFFIKEHHSEMAEIIKSHLRENNEI